MSQAQLAERLGISRRSVSDLETGERTITASELPLLCQALGTTLGMLLAEVPQARRMLGI